MGVFGGTFDPIHTGHVAAAVAVRDRLGLERVLFVVANDPWKKADRDIAPAADRLDMVRAALGGTTGLEASDIEITRGGISYTADTLDELAGRYREATLYLIVGADIVGELDTWERASELRERARLVVLTRPGTVLPPGAPSGWGGEIAEIPAVDLSSTEVRARLVAGEDVGDLVARPVLDIIESRGLYGGSGHSVGRRL